MVHGNQKVRSGTSAVQSSEMTMKIVSALRTLWIAFLCMPMSLLGNPLFKFMHTPQSHVINTEALNGHVSNDR